jgi:hypothetical protein
MISFLRHYCGGLHERAQTTAPKLEASAGRESEMIPRPEFQPRFRGAEKLMGKMVARQGAYAAAVRYV